MVRCGRIGFGYLGLADLGVSLEGNIFKNSSSSLSSRDLVVPDFFVSDSDKAAISLGAGMMCGVRKIKSSVRASLLILRLKRFPSSGISPRKGILLSASVF